MISRCAFHIASLLAQKHISAQMAPQSRQGIVYVLAGFLGAVAAGAGVASLARVVVSSIIRVCSECNNERIRGFLRRCIQRLCVGAMDFNFFPQIKKRAFLGSFFIYVKGIFKGIFKDF
jgi:hypothetical protein